MTVNLKIERISCFIPTPESIDPTGSKSDVRGAKDPLVKKLTFSTFKDNFSLPARLPTVCCHRLQAATSSDTTRSVLPYLNYAQLSQIENFIAIFTETVRCTRFSMYEIYRFNPLNSCIYLKVFSFILTIYVQLKSFFFLKVVSSFLSYFLE